MSITGFGHDGPDGGRAGYDQIAQGEGGLMSITGAVEPTKVGVPIADLLAGMYGAYGAVAALHERSITGKGRVVRTSLLARGVHPVLASPVVAIPPTNFACVLEKLISAGVAMSPES